MSWSTDRTYHGVGNPSFTFVKGGEDVYTVNVDVGDHWYGEDQSPFMEIMDMPLGEPARIMLDGTRKATHRGIHFGFALFWPTSNPAGRATLALAMSWLMDGGQLKFKPHRDKDDEYYVELLNPALSRYVAGSSAWVGYELAVECQTVYPMSYMPADIEYDYWCATWQGLILDGVNDEVDFGAAASLNTTGDKLDISFWWCPQDVVADKRIISKAGAFLVWQTVGAVAGTRIEAEIYIGAASKKTSDVGWAADLDADTPHLIRVVADGAELKLYVDGVDKGGAAAAVGNIDTNANKLIIGSDGAAADFADGIIWLLEITDPDADDKYLLRARFINHDGLGTTVKDFGPGQNDGTINGAAVFNQPSYAAGELSHWCSVDEVAEHAAGEYAAAEISYWTPNPQTLNPNQGTFD